MSLQIDADVNWIDAGVSWIDADERRTPDDSVGWQTAEHLNPRDVQFAI